MLDQLSVLPILLFSIIVHEVAHGAMALRLGDPTARDLGRLTLNPIPHIDPLGSVIIPLIAMISPGGFFIAWAKPVPVNPQNFSNQRRDDILVSIVGPLSNIALALCCSFAFILVSHSRAFLSPDATMSDEVVRFLLKMFAGGITVNIVLAVFNMLPVPPLDGSHVLAALLPPALGHHYRRIGFFGIIIIILLMSFEPVSRTFAAIIAALQYPFQFLIQSLT